jgi:hypothetical protein
MKFKIGDKVRIVSMPVGTDVINPHDVRNVWTWHDYHQLIAGQIGTIRVVDEADTTYKVSVDDKSSKYWFLEQWLEEVKEIEQRIGTALYDWQKENDEIAELKKKRDENLSLYFS